MPFRGTSGFSPSWLTSNYRQTCLNFFLRFGRSAASSIPPTLAYLALVESFKLYEIKLWQLQQPNLTPSAMDAIRSAFDNAGCHRNVLAYDYGIPYTGSMTSAINPNEVLLFTPQPRSKREHDELYAMAGHEAIHAEDSHAIQAETALFFSYEFCRAMTRDYFVTAAARRSATLASFGIAFFMYAQVSRQLEYQADSKSAERLGTQKTLCRLFHDTPSNGDPLHPSSTSREEWVSHTHIIF